MQLGFESSFAKVTIEGIFDPLLKFVTFTNSQFSGLQETREQN